MAITFLSLAAVGILACAPLFWSLPTTFLHGVSAAAGIAAINAVGNLAGFAAPYLIGAIKDATQSTNLGLTVIAAFLLVGAVIVIRLPAKLVSQ